MSFRSLVRAAVVAAAVVLPVAASAQSITYAFTGTGTGSFGGQAFTDAPFTIRVVSAAGAAPTVVFPGVLNVLDLPATIDIAGVTTGAGFGDLVRVFVNQNLGAVGVSQNGIFGADLFNVIAGSVATLSTYTLTAPFGPITGTPDAINQFSGVTVGGQTLTFTSASGVATFEAIGGIAAVPEPSTWLLLGSGLAVVGLVAVRRRQV